MDRISHELEAHCLIGRQRAWRLTPAIDGPGVPFPHQEQRGKTAPGWPRRDPQMVPDLGQSPWIEQLPPAHDHGHGMNEQREAVADRPIESEQQRKRHNQLADAQSVRSLHRQRHPVKVTSDARGSARKNELLDAPLQQKRAEKESQNEERGWSAFVEFGEHERLLGHALRSSVTSAFFNRYETAP